MTAYHIRLPDQKRAAVTALHELNFRVIAAGDSYNDTAMLGEADAGILFRPPHNVIARVPAVPGHAQLRRAEGPRSSRRAAAGREGAGRPGQSMMW